MPAMVQSQRRLGSMRFSRTPPPLYIVMAYMAMAYIVMAHIIMAYAVIANVVTA